MKERKKDHFVYHSPNKRFTVVGVVLTNTKKILDIQSNSEVEIDIPVALKFGVSITKRKDLWSPADKFVAKLGETKALGKAKSKSPDHIYILKPKSNPEKTFLAWAFRVGMIKLEQVEERLIQEETIYEKGRQIDELLQFYYRKQTLRSSRR